ncbi:serine/threonine-protein kinase CTR1-like [Humulus lupulus]|uniref:serine/threonine-protein kinase CTR1-like n=1 Tax=Humulus lupulus TaxID=3486 RepID=UPI002B406439|nr:serine/threonine-protein kinase CTR1-like [Humulus lupulus]
MQQSGCLAEEWLSTVPWVRLGWREYLVDLLEMAGVLSQPDSSLNSALSISVSSPLCHPKFKSVKTVQNFQMLAKLYFIEFGSLSLAFDDNSSVVAWINF